MSERTEIWLVDDNPRDAEMAIHALTTRKVANKITWVQDGAEALEHLFGSDPPGPDVVHHPRVILLDLKLPRVDGLEFLARVKNHAVARTIPVVVLTSSREAPDIARAYELGANSYIVKPVSFDNFSQTIAHLGMYWAFYNEPEPPSSKP